ncbi:hypothetical protein, partial [Burkholderia cenocepacia]|uniref:hypothetical protein n=1 Tax=Burkholderia cenocepacia TaxID=95486 RepID=UPI00406D4D51
MYYPHQSTIASALPSNPVVRPFPSQSTHLGRKSCIMPSCLQRLAGEHRFRLRLANQPDATTEIEECHKDIGVSAHTIALMGAMSYKYVDGVLHYKHAKIDHKYVT